jgi:hypothetical protein
VLILNATPVVEQECDNLKRDMEALEIFLQDQEDHKNYCPKIEWEQPSIEVYKKELKSQLPANCDK